MNYRNNFKLLFYFGDYLQGGWEPIQNQMMMIEYLLRVRDEFHIPMLYVNHDPDEVAALRDEVVILNDGRILKRGIPQAVFGRDDRPHYIST